MEHLLAFRAVDTNLDLYPDKYLDLYPHKYQYQHQHQGKVHKRTGKQLVVAGAVKEFTRAFAGNRVRTNQSYPTRGEGKRPLRCCPLPAKVLIGSWSTRRCGERILGKEGKLAVRQERLCLE